MKHSLVKQCLLLGVAASLGGAAYADAPVPILVVIPVAPPVVNLEVDEDATGASAVWEAIKSGKMSPEDAWEQGLLDAQSLYEDLSKGLVSGENGNSKELRPLLGGLLVQHAPDVVADTTKLPKPVQLVLADYYASQNDEKAVPLYEAVLEQTAAPYEQGLVLNALGGFWSGQRQPQKAQEAYERGLNVLTGKYPVFAGEMLLWIGHAWASAGDWNKANSFYSRIAAEGSPLMSSLGSHAQAMHLLGEGKSQEALALVQETLKGAQGPMDRAIGLMDVAQCLYRQQKWGEARQAAQESIQESAKQPNPNPSIGMNAVDNTARDLIQWSQLWQKQPLVCSSQELTHPVSSPTAKRHVWKTSFRVRSAKFIPLNVSSDDPHVKCTVESVLSITEGWLEQKSDLFSEQTVDVEVPIESNLSTKLHINSPGLAHAGLDIELKVGF